MTIGIPIALRRAPATFHTINMSTAIQGNRLHLEKSPYLLQHATNPIHWYSWCNEAFAAAQSQNKPIFLSVGYSCCHWCHVMEKESFRDNEVAALMNEYFISIKVDREERPDVDKLYMEFIQKTNGGGGWPMSVFLTPELKPIFGGTYFPPTTAFGVPGFKTILALVAREWEIRPNNMAQIAERLLITVKGATPIPNVQNFSAIPSEQIWQKCFKQLENSYDEKNGGFSNAPKFPQPSMLNALFHMHYIARFFPIILKRTRQMTLFTLRKIAMGGIHDHVNGGIARYSVDNRWHVPHFEKMLYDQAQLAVLYCEAYVMSKDDFYLDALHDILKYVMRDLSHAEGGFFGAEDADSYPYEGAPQKKEGAFCVWEHGELVRLLGDDVELFNFHYNVGEEGNLEPHQDPHDQFAGKNVLTCFETYNETAAKFDKDVPQVKEILRKCHQILYDERQKRPKPQKDTKIITAWNGLMISAFAKAAFVLDDDTYRDRAIRAADFLRKYMYNEGTKTLFRCVYGDGDCVAYNAHPINAFLDDYTFLIRGLIDLYEATLNVEYLQWADTLQARQNLLFWDNEEHTGYFNSPAGDASLLMRLKDDQDGAEPCGNSVAVLNLLRLHWYLKREAHCLKVNRILRHFSKQLNTIPLAVPEMVCGLILYYHPPIQIFIAGKKDDDRTKALLNVVRRQHIPFKVLATFDDSDNNQFMKECHGSLGIPQIDGKPTVYICKDFSCYLPCTEPEQLEEFFNSSKDEENMAAKKCAVAKVDDDGDETETTTNTSESKTDGASASTSSFTTKIKIVDGVASTSTTSFDDSVESIGTDEVSSSPDNASVASTAQKNDDKGTKNN